MQSKRRLLRPIAYISAGFLIGMLALIAGSKVISADPTRVAECNNNWVLENGGDQQPVSYIYQPCTGQVFMLVGNKATLVAFPK
ncbi:MAG: hypothetical protein OXG08_03870 [Gammaproteobacteria bacterium]|nr:hypothetical protein [Gammaproteobacteria bacterium]